MTGKGGDIIVEDDMINPYEAESEALRDHAIRFHKNVLTSRLDDPKAGRRVIVEQRTHNKDLSAHVLKEEEGWVHLNLEQVASRPTVIDFPISRRTVERKPGDLIEPRRMGQKEVDNAKKAMGTRAFVAQHQQNPTAEEGNIIRRDWWRRWRIPPEGADITVQSWDMTFKETESGSYVVGQVWKKRGPNFYLMDQFRKRVDFADTIPAILNLSTSWPEATAKLIEEKANGPAIMSQLRSRLDGMVPIEPSGTKVARAQAVAPLIEAGNVYLPADADWADDFIEECAAFTGAKRETNDQVDAMSQALIWLHGLDFHVPEADEEVGTWLDTHDQQIAGGFQ